ncbi:MAG: hypothetical protein HYZ14_16910 [Bacteroidetes bacterium]|nr:hypothetical protein [Bacteroidota bacterium]
MKKAILLLVLIILASHADAQKWSSKRKYSTRKNTMYFYWGYNRDIYSKSDVNFQGPGYNFIAEDLEAHDRPSREFSTYVNIKSISVPQFNVRVGYYYADHWDLSVGYDHMKYVMAGNQTLYLVGTIATTNSELNGVYDRSTGKIPIREQDLHYENTNGLNYISLQLNNTTPRFETKNQKFAIHQRLGMGVGPVVTQTDFFWDGQEYHSRFGLTGFGISAHTGVRFDFFNRFFFQSNWSGGFIYLPHNRTIQDAPDFARQKFVYGQWELLGGIFFYVPAINGCDSCPDWH